MEKKTKTPRELPTDMANMSETAQAYALLRKEGLENKAACKSLKIKESYGYQIQHQTKNLIKDDSKLVSLARRNLKKLAQGKKYGEIQQVKDSTSLAAVNAILDRADPIIKHVETKSISFNVEFDINALK